MIRPVLLVATLAAALLLPGAATAAEAPVTRGMRAPPLDARDGPTLAALRGRMVLLEFFGTLCPHCQRLAPRLGAIHTRYAPRGIVVWGVTPDAPDALSRYRREHGVRHATSRVPMDALREYVVPKYPVLLLISPTGRVLWRGAPERLTDAVLDAYLARVRLLPDVPAGHAALRPLLDAGRYGAVEAHLERLRTCRGLDAEDCRFVLDTLAWIAWHREQAFADAAHDLERGRAHAAWRTYADLAWQFDGTPHAARAAHLRDALRADPAHAIDAAEALARARRAGRWRDDETAARHLDAVVRAWRGTDAATEAARLVAILRGT